MSIKAKSLDEIRANISEFDRYLSENHDSYDWQWAIKAIKNGRRFVAVRCADGYRFYRNAA